MKRFPFILLLLFIAGLTFSQQRPPFSDEMVETDGLVFFPFLKGEIKQEYILNNQSDKPYSTLRIDQLKSGMGKINDILSTWNSFNPPQGVSVFFYNMVNHRDESHGKNKITGLTTLYVSSWFADSQTGKPTTNPEVHADLDILLNEPSVLGGAPLLADIYLSPRQVTDFFGFPVCQNNRREITIISKKNIPLFLPVSREDYLKTMISKLEQKVAEDRQEQQRPESQQSMLTFAAEKESRRKEFEKAYNELLKWDKKAAEDVKKAWIETEAALDQQAKEPDAGTTRASLIDESNKLLTKEINSLKNDMEALSPEERKEQAWWENGRTESNSSGLAPSGQGEALVRINPALIDPSRPESEIQLMVLRWSVRGSTGDYDKPRLYNQGKEGYHLQDWTMAQLCQQETLWKQIFELVK